MYKAKAMIDKKDKDMPEALHDAFSDTTKHVLDKDESSKLDDTILEEIYNKVEEFDILNKPMLPKFECPRGLTEEAYLKELCEAGWDKLLKQAGKIDDPEKEQEYRDRFEEEFEVIKGADLFGYFLIVQDIIDS